MVQMNDLITSRRLTRTRSRSNQTRRDIVRVQSSGIMRANRHDDKREEKGKEPSL
jgi:hypothetical protein